MARPKKDIEIIEEQPKRRDKKIMTLFFLMIPSLLLAMTATISNVIVRFGFQIVLLLFHFVVFKNLLDTYLGEE
jgi:hypothetical protein